MTLALYPYYRFENCCTGEIFEFRGTIAGFVSPSTYRSTIDNVLTRNDCYIVTQPNTSDTTFWNALPDIALESIVYISAGSAGCSDPTCNSCEEPCGECPEGYVQVGETCVKGQQVIPFPYCSCYLLIPCDPSQVPIIADNPALAGYLNEFVSVFFTPGGERYCVYVTEFDGGETCLNPPKVFIDPDIPCDCPTQCYYISGADGVVTVTTDGGLVELTPLQTQPYIKICSNTYPLVGNADSNYQIISLGDCVDGLCPVQCYKLVNCQNPDVVIYTNSDSVLPYLYGTNNRVQIIGHEGCWEVQNLLDNETCDCPVDVVITSSYASCPDCIGYIAYKLTSCIGNDVIYSLLNLEDYIDKYIKLDCGCYLVEQINYLPPNPQTIIKLDDGIYSSCIECTNQYWILEDCAKVSDPIITYTDLSVYEGKVIKVKDCDECWEVSPTEEFLNATTVVVTESFEDCIACDTDLPCICTRLTNYGDKPKTYIYLDCDKKYNEITLQPGESTEKLCTIAWYTLPYCSCVIIKQTIEYSPGNPISQAITAYAIPGEEINGYPVYSLCQGPTCGTISFDGTYWVIYDENGTPVYQLTNNLSTECLVGDWDLYGGDPLPNIFTIESYTCPTECNCISLEIREKGTPVGSYTYYISGYDNDGYAIWMSSDQTSQITHTANCPQTLCQDCWKIYINGVDQNVELCHEECPVGRFFPPNGDLVYETKDCTQPVVYPSDFTSTDYFETFGECQNGVCPHPIFKNNRTVRPGYNTPICTPEKYDMITCNFADILYKIALEKRYGITNCCPDDDDKWLIQKELIDLQALKDPNYNCSECTCGCSKGNACDTCNCKN